MFRPSRTSSPTSTRLPALNGTCRSSSRRRPFTIVFNGALSTANVMPLTKAVTGGTTAAIARGPMAWATKCRIGPDRANVSNFWIGYNGVYGYPADFPSLHEPHGRHGADAHLKQG